VLDQRGPGPLPVCALELAHYPLRMIAMNALPPAPPLDEAGRTGWLKRIGETPPWVLRWLAEQRDGPYWRNGSLQPSQRIGPGSGGNVEDVPSPTNARHATRTLIHPV
jgi:hypothetical protein